MKQPGVQPVGGDIQAQALTVAQSASLEYYERIVEDDVKQAATVIATFVWEAANRPEMMPRKPLSQADLAPSATAAAPH